MSVLGNYNVSGTFLPEAPPTSTIGENFDAALDYMNLYENSDSAYVGQQRVYEEIQSIGAELGIETPFLPGQVDEDAYQREHGEWIAGRRDTPPHRQQFTNDDWNQWVLAQPEETRSKIIQKLGFDIHSDSVEAEANKRALEARKVLHDVSDRATTGGFVIGELPGSIAGAFQDPINIGVSVAAAPLVVSGFVPFVLSEAVINMVAETAIQTGTFDRKTQELGLDPEQVRTEAFASVVGAGVFGGMFAGGLKGLAVGARAILKKINPQELPDVDRQILEAVAGMESDEPDVAIAALTNLKKNKGISSETSSLIDVLIDDLEVRKTDPATPETKGSFSHETHARLIDEATDSINNGRLSEPLKEGNPYSSKVEVRGEDFDARDARIEQEARQASPQMFATLDSHRTELEAVQAELDELKARTTVPDDDEKLAAQIAKVESELEKPASPRRLRRLEEKRDALLEGRNADDLRERTSQTAAERKAVADETAALTKRAKKLAKDIALLETRVETRKANIAKTLPPLRTVTKVSPPEAAPAAPAPKPIDPVEIAQAKTGEPFANRLFHGDGRADQSDVYNGPAIPILGEGRYYAATEDVAGKYGPRVVSEDVQLDNPLVISSDDQWRALAKQAGWKFPNPFGLPEDEVKVMVDAMRRVISDAGHDGVIVRIDPDFKAGKSDHGKLLADVFGDDQVVSFKPRQEAPDSIPLVPGSEAAASNARYTRPRETPTDARIQANDDLAEQSARSMADDPELTVLDVNDGTVKPLKEVLDDSDQNLEAFDQILACMGVKG